MRGRWLLVAWVTSFAIGCPGADAPATPPTSPTTKATTTGEPPPSATTAGPEPGSLAELVTGNVASTDLSALVTIKAARIEGQGGAPPSTTGYVNHVYDVEVVTCVHGCSNVKTFTFGEMAEAGNPTKKVGSSVMVSACRSGPSLYFTPDVGYLISADDLPPNLVSELAAKPPPREKSACAPTP